MYVLEAPAVQRTLVLDAPAVVAVTCFGCAQCVAGHTVCVQKPILGKNYLRGEEPQGQYSSRGLLRNRMQAQDFKRILPSSICNPLKGMLLATGVIAGWTTPAWRLCAYRKLGH